MGASHHGDERAKHSITMFYDDEEHPEPIDDDAGECPFCGAQMDSREVFSNCDDVEIFCPECNYIAGVE